MRKDIKTNGDDLISSSDANLWSLTYHCLLKFQVPVIFKHQMFNVPNGTDEYIIFCITEGLPNSVTCYDFIVKETEHLKRDKIPASKSSFENGFPGTHIEVAMFSGLNGYVEHEKCKEMFRKAFDRALSEHRKQSIQTKRDSFKVIK